MKKSLTTPTEDSASPSCCASSECHRLLSLAKLIAISAHAGQYRRDGVTPYINHPEAVAKRLKGDCDAEMVAWLHDVIEDTDLGPSDLLARGVPRDVIEAVVVLTKGAKVSYEVYIATIEAHPLARRVKIADMLANLADSPTTEQIIKYSKALLFLHNH